MDREEASRHGASHARAGKARTRAPRPSRAWRIGFVPLESAAGHPQAQRRRPAKDCYASPHRKPRVRTSRRDKKRTRRGFDASRAPHGGSERLARPRAPAQGGYLPRRSRQVPLYPSRGRATQAFTPQRVASAHRPLTPLGRGSAARRIKRQEHSLRRRRARGREGSGSTVPRASRMGRHGARGARARRDGARDDAGARGPRAGAPRPAEPRGAGAEGRLDSLSATRCRGFPASVARACVSHLKEAPKAPRGPFHAPAAS